MRRALLKRVTLSGQADLKATKVSRNKENIPHDAEVEVYCEIFLVEQRAMGVKKFIILQR